MNRILNAVVASVAALALVAATGIILGPNSQDADPQVRGVGTEVGEVLRFDGYSVKFDSVDDAVSFVGAPLVVRGLVNGVGEPRWNGPGGQRMTLEEEWTSGLPSYIWIPIDFTVTDVLRGELPDTGPSLVVRSLGGTIGEVRVDFGEMNALPEVAAGDELVLFLDVGVDVGDGFAAWTPSFAYRVDEGVAVAGNRTHQASMTQLVDAITEGPATRPTEGEG